MKSLLILLVILICGCSVMYSIQALRLKYPTEQIINVPGSRYEYLIKATNGDIYYVFYDGVYGAKVDEIKPILMFKGDK